LKALECPELEEIRAARERIRGSALRTPLVPLRAEGLPARVLLKLENLQPIGAFKLRGAASAMAAADPDQLAHGVVTASSGSMAQGVAWCARERGIPCRVVMPDHAPQTKIDALQRLGGVPLIVPFARWWQCLEERGHPDLDGAFIHPVSDPAVIAGNATIALEILEDCPEVDAIVAPYGGGGLSCGLAASTRALAPNVQVHAAESESAAPLAASLSAGEPVEVERSPSFVDGIGAASLLPEMWPLARDLLAGSLVVSLEAIEEAIRLLVRCNHVIAEGAGAASVAAALDGRAGSGTVVCVVSGGNIDPSELRRILSGAVVT